MTDVLREVGRRWSRAAARERLLRVERDEAIVHARSTGVGVREIARVVGIDPGQVVRVLKRGVRGAD